MTERTKERKTERNWIKRKKERKIGTWKNIPMYKERKKEGRKGQEKISLRIVKERKKERDRKNIPTYHERKKRLENIPTYHERKKERKKESEGINERKKWERRSKQIIFGYLHPHRKKERKKVKE